MIAAYLRVSTGKQHPANQQDEIRRFAESRNWVVDKWVVEVASGCRHQGDRKLGALLRRLKKGDILVVTEISRLSRTLTDVMSIMGLCLKKGIKFYTTKEGYAFDDSINSKVLCFAFGLVAEIERNLISMRTREALALRRAEGVVLGRRKGLYSALGMILIYVLLGNAVMFAFAGDFTRMFVDAAESEIIAKSVMFLQTSCPFWIFLGTLCVLRYSIQGLGLTRLAMMSGVFERVARIAASLWLVPALGFKGVCLGDPMAWMAACLFLIPAMSWILHRLMHPASVSRHGHRIPVGQH